MESSSDRSNPAPKFARLAALFGLFYFWQGIGEPTDGLLTQPLKELMLERGHTEDAVGTFGFLLEIPWAIKPLYGLITDALPLAGYRRKSYLVVAGCITALGMFGLASQPTSIGEGLLIAWLVPPAVAIAFSDVAVDALMIERTQRLGWIGQMQSIQWTCLYGAGALAGWAGGYLTEYHLLRLGFLVVGAGALCTITAALFAYEDRSLAQTASGSRVIPHLVLACRTPALLAAAAFLLLWAFNPFSNTVLQVHMRNELNLPPRAFGNSVAWNSLASMAGAACYGLVRSRVKDIRWLLHGAIVLGIVSTVAYAAVRDEISAQATSAIAGFTWAMALLIQLDLAATVCPLAIAGTVFAVLMSLSNLSTSGSALIGTFLYKHWREQWGAQTAFNLLVATGAATTAACWLVMPWLSRKIGAQEPQT